eukprot:5914146-Karenia_brevis.AAC.1
MATRNNEEETPCMEGVTEFHFIGADEIRDKKFSYGEHKGKMLSEVAREVPGYSRKFDGARSERIPAYFKEYLGRLRVQMPEASSGSRD